ncbi:MAG: type II secretion system protein [Acidobacteriaceae bacterium]|nr:type II secretion system protein [Acidobacteriaceae bacterium]
MASSEHKPAQHGRDGEQGFMLVWVIFMVFLVLLALSIAAPKVAKDLKREKELETIRRGNQYVRAIQLFYHKQNGAYPASLDALKNTNNIRFLRQEYVDPMTGQTDWKPILVGKAQTTPKGFFGKPLSDAPGNSGSPGLSSSSMTFGGSGSGSGFGGFGGSSSGFGGSSSGFGGSSSGFGGSSGGFGGSSASYGSSSGSSPGSAGSGGSKDSIFGSSGPGGGGPFVGVSIPKTGDSLTILNEMTTYDTWEFVYFPQLEQYYKAQAALNGGTGGGGLPGSSSNPGNSTGSGSSGSSSPFGGSSSSPFGGSSSSSSGGSSGLSFGGSGSSSGSSIFGSH